MCTFLFKQYVKWEVTIAPEVCCIYTHTHTHIQTHETVDCEFVKNLLQI